MLLQRVDYASRAAEDIKGLSLLGGEFAETVKDGRIGRPGFVDEGFKVLKF